jgi:hypothetical protein
MEDAGYLVSRLSDELPKSGGMRLRYYRINGTGQRALNFAEGVDYDGLGVRIG